MPRGVPKKKKVNMSEAIRDYAKAHTNASTSEIVAGLAEMGVKVTPQLVSNVRLRGGIKRKGRPRNVDLDIDTLLELNVVVKRVGGIEQAHRALDKLLNLRESLATA